MVNDSGKQLHVSSAETENAFVLNAGSYRESMDFDHISGGTVTMTFGDLAKSFSGSSVVTSGALTINGGNGPTFSAEIKNGDIGGNFTITMEKHPTESQWERVLMEWMSAQVVLL